MVLLYNHPISLSTPVRLDPVGVYLCEGGVVRRAGYLCEGEGLRKR